MIRITLTDFQRRELENFRRQSSSKDSEKALMVLLNAGGASIPVIAESLKRNPHTVRLWLKRYIEKRLSGLSRMYSPGRPRNKKDLVKSHAREILPHSPQDYGYLDTVWTVPLIVYDLKKTKQIDASDDTVTRSLKEMGYTYKRPSKRPAGHDRISKEEKIAVIDRICNNIKELSNKEDSVIYALDESHFSTEPYLVRGWFFKRWPPPNNNTGKKGECHVLWMLESQDVKILLEEVRHL